MPLPKWYTGLQNTGHLFYQMFECNQTRDPAYTVQVLPCQVNQLTPTLHGFTIPLNSWVMLCYLGKVSSWNNSWGLLHPSRKVMLATTCYWGHWYWKPCKIESHVQFIVTFYSLQRLTKWNNNKLKKCW